MIEVIEGQQLVATSSLFNAIFRVDVANQMSAPTGGAVRAIVDLNTGEDVTTDIVSSTNGTIESTTFLKLPAMTGFTANREYSVRFSFTDGTNTLPGEIRLRCVF